MRDQLSSTPQLYSHRLVSVYQGLTDELAQHLAHRYNRATEFTNKLTTQDKVYNEFENNIICDVRFTSVVCDYIQ